MFYYTTVNGKPNGRASHFFKSKENADSRCSDQNARAESMGIKAKYVVSSHNGVGIDPREIR